MVSCRRSKGRKSQSPTLAPLQPPHALVAQNSPNRFQRIRLRQNPCAPIRDKFAFGKLCFLFSPTHLFLKCLTHFGISSIIKIFLIFNIFIDRKPSPLFLFPLASPISKYILGEGASFRTEAETDETLLCKPPVCVRSVSFVGIVPTSREKSFSS